MDFERVAVDDACHTGDPILRSSWPADTVSIAPSAIARIIMRHIVAPNPSVQPTRCGVIEIELFLVDRLTELGRDALALDLTLTGHVDPVHHLSTAAVDYLDLPALGHDCLPIPLLLDHTSRSSNLPRLRVVAHTGRGMTSDAGKQLDTHRHVNIIRTFGARAAGLCAFAQTRRPEGWRWRSEASSGNDGNRPAER
ncbi:MAG: hypothetical protein ACK4QW_07805 [Alphaproteobacteria bacterium]